MDLTNVKFFKGVYIYVQYSLSSRKQSVTSSLVFGSKACPYNLMWAQIISNTSPQYVVRTNTFEPEITVVWMKNKILHFNMYLMCKVLCTVSPSPDHSLSWWETSPSDWADSGAPRPDPPRTWWCLLSPRCFLLAKT